MNDLTRHGTLRVAVFPNFVIIDPSTIGSQQPRGVAPDLARELARQLGVPIAFQDYNNPTPLIAALESDACDVAFLAADPSRLSQVAFSPAYAEIEAGHLVPAGSRIGDISDVDRPGRTIASMTKTAYYLWLTRNLKGAKLVSADEPQDVLRLFVDDKLDALAALKPRLHVELQKLPGARILDGHFLAAQQAICTAAHKKEGAAALENFVTNARNSGLVQRLIDSHGATGLHVPR